MTSGQLWGGRFAVPLNEFLFSFNASLNVDHELLLSDLQGSEAYAEALHKAGVLNGHEFHAIQTALRSMRADYLAARLQMPETVEDVHSWIESYVIAKAGDAGRKLHTGRSRNDQVATAFRLWCVEASRECRQHIASLITNLLQLAEKYPQTIMPGYTHLQRAQPILFSHWVLAHIEPLRRDDKRFEASGEVAASLPLGSGALAGNSYPVDREMLAARLGFKSVARNSIDAVSDRDFAIELAFACSLALQHLSRLCEDLILYCSQEFAFLRMSDAIATGSSLMPQKKNPDIPELVRGKTGRVYGHLMALLTTMKGLPLAYNKDMQEDKQAVFDAVATTRECLQALAVFVQHLQVDGVKTRAAAGFGYLNATDLADYLVAKNVPFRLAHEQVGQLVQKAQISQQELSQLPLTEMQAVNPVITQDVYDVLNLENCLAQKKTCGGTNPEHVTKAMKEVKTWLSERSSSSDSKFEQEGS